MKFQYTTVHSFDGENESNLRILYEYVPGSPARGPTYDCGGTPAEGPEVYMLGMMVNDRAATNEQWDAVVADESLQEQLMIHGADCIADERAAAAEYRAEMRKDR